MPALKIMLSDYFSISNGRYHPELLRRYPILKDLEANKIDVIEFQSIPKLVRGNICDNYGFEFPLKAVCNFALECISSQLKKCTILNYEGKECELRFAKYIIQNSRALHTMSISNLTISYTNSSNCARQA
ncbi:uncharacterized protein LOC114372418 [Glycine soja]|uniref:uncharacterized protein LOC114372418 n=1 Tax=Glycine soja TaxID=3848 RepID=UPI00103B6004|nr:uncharacterized protein LOC114372418 [Glycine soja]